MHELSQPSWGMPGNRASGCVARCRLTAGPQLLTGLASPLTPPPPAAGQPVVPGCCAAHALSRGIPPPGPPQLAGSRLAGCLGSVRQPNPMQMLLSTWAASAGGPGGIPHPTRRVCEAAQGDVARRCLGRARAAAELPPVLQGGARHVRAVARVLPTPGPLLAGCAGCC